MADQPKTPDERILRAVELLGEAARDRLQRHPQGHLVAGARERIELAFPLPVSPDSQDVGDAAARAGEALALGVDGLVHHRAAFRPGRVYCLRCGTAGCEHAALPGPRSTFGGYGPSGVPRFLDFPQWLVERRDPRAGDLYGRSSGTAPRNGNRVVAVHVPGEELVSAVLPAFRERTGKGSRIHGQVTAGWYRAPDARGHPAPLAATFQVVSSRPRGNRRRFGLNVLVVGPEGEPAEALFEQRGEVPWGAEARWAQSVLAAVEQAATKKARKGAKAAEQAEHRAEARVEGLLKGLARRLEKGGRARNRRTRHAAERHDQGDRPTRMALADLAQAKDEDVLLDTRRSTFVVVGERGRAHVFNRQGKLVTSVRYSTEAIERRRERGRWKPLPKDEVEALRVMVGGGQGG
ncbi:MAG: hypothetical protein ACLF0P_07540 [Thermoanaerobaculia bacterium]